jgi:MoxR-like ATPase
MSNWSEALRTLVDRKVIPHHAHRILLYGPAGTGKSAWAARLFGDCERITLHQQMPPEDLIGSMGLRAVKQGTETVWQDGPAIRAMRDGKPLILDEVDQFSPELRCALHAVLDDWAQCQLTLVTGEVVTPSKGYCVIGTTNASPASLPEALLSRFDLSIAADSPAQGILDSLPDGTARLLERTYARQSVANWTPSVCVRSILAMQRISKILGLEEAAQVVFGDEATDLLSSIAMQS